MRQQIFSKGWFGVFPLVSHKQKSWAETLMSALCQKRPSALLLDFAARNACRDVGRAADCAGERRICNLSLRYVFRTVTHNDVEFFNSF